MRLATIVVAGFAVSVVGVLVGAWWAPFTVGLVIGIVERKPRLAIPLGAGIGLAAWLLPLGSAQLHYGLGAAARSLAEIMGFGKQGAIPVVLTLMVGVLLGLCGAWLGSAGRKVIAPTT